MRKMRRLAVASIVAAAALALGGRSLQAQTTAAPWSAAQTVTHATVVGGTGNTSYHAGIVAKFAIGDAGPSHAFAANYAPPASSVTKHPRMNWTAVAGATGYDLLMSTRSQAPTGACGCLVTSTTTATQVEIQSSTTSPYTVYPFPGGYIGPLAASSSTAARSSQMPDASGVLVLEGKTPANIVTGNLPENDVFPMTTGANVIGNPPLSDNGTDVQAGGGPAVAQGITAQPIESVLHADQFPGADMGAKINAAIAALPGTCGTVSVPLGNFNFSTRIVIPRCVSVAGAGSGITNNGAPAAGGTSLNWTPSSGIAVVDGDPSSQGADYPGVGGMRDLTLNATASGNTAIGLFLGGGTGSDGVPTDLFAAGQEFDAISITNFSVGVEWGSNAWTETFNNTAIGDFSVAGITTDGDIGNSGENNRFFSGGIYNGAGPALLDLDANAGGVIDVDLHFYGTSMDYSGDNAVGIFENASFSCDGCHIEKAFAPFETATVPIAVSFTNSIFTTLAGPTAAVLVDGVAQGITTTGVHTVTTPAGWLNNIAVNTQLNIAGGNDTVTVSAVSTSAGVTSFTASFKKTETQGFAISAIWPYFFQMPNSGSYFTSINSGYFTQSTLTNLINGTGSSDMTINILASVVHNDTSTLSPTTGVQYGSLIDVNTLGTQEWSYYGGTATFMQGLNLSPTGDGQLLALNNGTTPADDFYLVNAGFLEFENSSGVAMLSLGQTGDVGIAGDLGWGGGPSITSSSDVAQKSQVPISGTITLVSGAGSYTFPATYTTAPVCIVEDEAGSNIAVTKVVTTTSLAVTGTGADKIDYMCSGPGRG
ncbi:MAG: hypothetical protein ACRD04_07920 [Terriglobales bacterium]